MSARDRVSVIDMGVAKQSTSRDRQAAPSGIGERRKTAQRNGRADYTAKRAEIIAAAVAVFSEKGFHGATLNDVAEHLGTDRASLYYYVADKQELFQEAIKGLLEDNLAQAERINASGASAVEKLSDVVRMVLTSYAANYPQTFVYIQEDMARLAKDESSWAAEMLDTGRKINRIVHTLVEDAIAEGTFREDISPTVATFALWGMVNWTHRWFDPGRELSAGDVAESFLAIFRDGMTR